MSGAEKLPPPAPPKLKRSRNGCMECRRLHRRCGEEKPVCANCRSAGKVCSYQRTLSWGGRPFGKSTFRHALGSGVVEIPTADSETDSPFRRSFVYGQQSSLGGSSQIGSEVKVEPRSRSVPAAAVTATTDEESSSPSHSVIEITTPPLWLPWLSQHHRMLFHHFIDSTVTIFAGRGTEQQDIRSVIVPMAVDTNHGFSLLAAVISLASTHRMNLGLHQDVAEIEYWRDMCVGHLRRPTVQEDESTENVFAGSALTLAIRDVISDVEKSPSWRLHLQGALTVLARTADRPSTSKSSTRTLLQKIARSLQVRSPLPPPSAPQPRAGRDKRKRADSEKEVLGIPNDISSMLLQIRSLRLERNALHNIEINSGSSNMQPLWNALRGQCLEVIVQLKTLSESGDKGAGEDLDGHRLYGFVALLQIYSGILDLRTNDTGLRSTLDTAVNTLRGMHLDARPQIDAELVFPLFTIGCLARQPGDRESIRLLLLRISREHGKRNATIASTFLEELWRKSGSQNLLVRQADVDVLMTEKGWDISLW